MYLSYVGTAGSIDFGIGRSINSVVCSTLGCSRSAGSRRSGGCDCVSAVIAGKSRPYDVSGLSSSPCTCTQATPKKSSGNAYTGIASHQVICKSSGDSGTATGFGLPGRAGYLGRPRVYAFQGEERKKDLVIAVVRKSCRAWTALDENTLERRLVNAVAGVCETEPV